MFVKQDAHTDQPQQDEPHHEAGHDAGKIDPDVGDLPAAPRHEELDGLIGQRCEHPTQDGPRDMPQQVPRVHPQTEHEQEPLQHIFAEMGQLADDVHREMVRRAVQPQHPQNLLHPLQHPAAGPFRDSGHLHGVGEDEGDAADERKGKDHPPGQQPRRDALLLFRHQPSALMLCSMLASLS